MKTDIKDLQMDISFDCKFIRCKIVSLSIGNKIEYFFSIQFVFAEIPIHLCIYK